jgi:FAD binding domain
LIVVVDCCFSTSKPNPNSHISPYIVTLAAHAMPPLLGQGANQAIQDAYCLATKLYDYNVAVATEPLYRKDEQERENEEIAFAPTTPTSLRSLLQEYERIRWAATFQIFWYVGVLCTAGLISIFEQIVLAVRSLLTSKHFSCALFVDNRKSVFLGYLGKCYCHCLVVFLFSSTSKLNSQFVVSFKETGGNDGLYAKFRDVFFKTMGILGVARIILLSAAVPKV